MKHLIEIQPLESIISRDARPFDTTPGVIAYSMNDFSPSMIAGTIRTVLGKQVSLQDNGSPNNIFKKASLDAIKKLVVRGPLYKLGDTLFYPFPEDIYAFMSSDSTEGLQISFRSPVKPTGGFLGAGSQGLYEGLLWPAVVPSRSKEIHDKPAYVSEDLMIKWLSAHPDESMCQEVGQLLAQWRGNERKLESPSHFLQPFAKDVRHHTEIDTNRRISQEANLFTTEAIAVPVELTLLAEVEWKSEELEWPSDLSAIHSMGGKRRLAHLQQLEGELLPRAPKAIIQALNGSKYIRMVLATPAYFSKGWKPGWLDGDMVTNDSWKHQVKLKLRWANIPEWLPYSGWSYKEQREKAIRRMVPAGSVYFFEVVSGNPSELAENLWLESVSDDNRRKEAHDRDDGFGLALWGVWEPKD